MAKEKIYHLRHLYQTGSHTAHGPLQYSLEIENQLSIKYQLITASFYFLSSKKQIPG